jgi:uncharacterized protein (TIGR03546 family)
MYWLVRLIQGLVKALHSEGTPGQVAAGFVLGAAIGLTPLASLHNLVFLLAILLFTVSVPGAVLGWVVFTPIAFLLDPLFDRVGAAMLGEGALEALYGTIYSTPVLAYTNLTNSVVLGSLVGWCVLALPIFFGMRWSIARYRAAVYARYKDARLLQAVRASKVYNLYRILRP